MSFSRRMVVLTAGAVAVAIAFAALAAFVAVSRNLHEHLDGQLRAFGDALATGVRLNPRGPGDLDRPRGPIRLPLRGLDTTGDAALLMASGTLVKAPSDTTKFHITSSDLRVAGGLAPAYFHTADLAGTPVRVYTVPAGTGRAVVAETGLSDLNRSLDQLTLILAIIVLAGVSVACGLAVIVVKIGTSPVHELREAAEHVALTGDLTRRLEVGGDDDLGKLGRSFNKMLESLHESQRAQQQLVGDASHELRTPIASLRTNLEVLQRERSLGRQERSALLGDLVQQATEMGELVEDLLDSARNGDGDDQAAAHRLDLLIEDEVDQLAPVYANIRFESALAPTTIYGREHRLKRAIGNLLENAAKWSPDNGHVSITLDDGRLQVRDHGPGFREEDLKYVFDRFYRSPAARSMPGAGLGLSIVRRVAQEHNGDVWAGNAPDGGALMTLRLPTSELSRQAAGSDGPSR